MDLQNLGFLDHGDQGDDIWDRLSGKQEAREEGLVQGEGKSARACASLGFEGVLTYGEGSSLAKQHEPGGA